MSIKVISAQNLCKDFEDLFEDMQSVNYSVSHTIVAFTFSQKVDFSLEDLSLVIKTVFPLCRSVDGIFGTTSFASIEKEINRCFAFNPHYHWEDISQETIGNRIHTFWTLVGKYFTMPPLICYQYDPCDNKCFDFGTRWNFCFILLNDKGQGIILHAGAAD